MKVALLQPGARTPDFVRIEDSETPEPGDGEVLVRMRAASLNYRDLIVAEGAYAGLETTQRLVPLSDGTGEVVEAGSGVQRWRKGDRVMASFFQDWVDGPFLNTHMKSALGGGVDGVLAEYRVFPEHGISRVPDHLSWEQGATLPCAALTAWHALFERTPLYPGQTVLVLGSGGVSVFALQFARSCGASVIATSSSNQKLQKLGELGASGLINYQERPDWEKAVLDITGGAGVDQVIEVGGAGTLPKSLVAASTGGRVSLIGRLTGIQDRIDPRPIMAKGLTVHGIYVGSVAMLERMNRAITTSGLVPVIDRVFSLEQTADAYRYMRLGKHFGKIVIRL